MREQEIHNPINTTPQLTAYLLVVCQLGQLLLGLIRSRLKDIIQVLRSNDSHLDNDNEMDRIVTKEDKKAPPQHPGDLFLLSPNRQRPGSKCSSYLGRIINFWTSVVARRLM